MLVFAFFLLASTLAVLIPFFNPGLTSGHDIASHMFRIQLFYQALTAGQFPVTWIEGVLVGMNHPQFIFYPPFFYYLTSLPQLLGVPYVTSAYLVLGLATILGFAGIYLFVRVYFNQFAALAAAIAFTLAPYRILVLYVRGAFTEYLALSLVPFAFWGVALISQNKKIGVGIAAIALAAVTLSHPPSLVMSAPLLAAFVLALWVREQKNIVLGRSLMAAILGAGLSGFFTLPAILEQKYIAWQNLISGYYNFRQHFANLSQIIYSPWGYGVSQAGLNDGMSFALGAVGWLAVIGAVILFFSKTSFLNKFWTGFFTLGVAYAIFLAINTSLPIWEAVKILSFTQYPWRFIGLATFCSSLLLAPLVNQLFVYRNLTNMIILIFATSLIVGLSLPILKPATYFPRDKFDLDKQVFDQNSTDPTFGLETGYLPVWAKRLDTTLEDKNKVRLISGAGEAKLTTDTPAKKIIAVETGKPSTVRVAVHFFPGWKATINPQPFTQELTIKYDNPEGVIDILVPKGRGNISLEFTPTPVRIAGETASLITLGLLILDQISPSVASLMARRKR